MKLLFAAILLSLFSFVASAADIASVNFDALKDDLREYYLSKPENAARRKEYETAQEAERKQMEAMQKKFMGGDKSIDLSSLMEAGAAASRFDLERKLDSDLKKELYGIISGLGLKYDLIYDSADPEAIIFSKSQIDDVTPAVKQAIIELKKKK